MVMKLDSKQAFRKNLQLGVSSALMIVIGYPGELILEQDMLWKRWIFWALAVVPFLYIVYELTVGLSGALETEKMDHIKHRRWSPKVANLPPCSTRKDGLRSPGCPNH